MLQTENDCSERTVIITLEIVASNCLVYLSLCNLEVSCDFED